MKFKYSITADINPCDTIPKGHESDYREAIQEAFEKRLKTMLDEGWREAEFNENVRFGHDGEPENGVLFTGWISLNRETRNT